jgi:hypothetical protein
VKKLEFAADSLRKISKGAEWDSSSESAPSSSSASPGKRYRRSGNRPKTTCTVTRLHFQVTATKRSENKFRIADHTPKMNFTPPSPCKNGVVGEVMNKPEFFVTPGYGERRLRSSRDRTRSHHFWRWLTAMGVESFSPCQQPSETGRKCRARVRVWVVGTRIRKNR